MPLGSRSPVSGSMFTATTPVGCGYSVSGTSFRTFPAYAIQIGNAAWLPVSLGPMLVGTSNPIQEMATRRPMKPANQASMWSLVVPVFPARS